MKQIYIKNGFKNSFYFKISLNSISKRGNVLGDELYAQSIAKAVMEISIQKSQS